MNRCVSARSIIIINQPEARTDHFQLTQANANYPQFEEISLCHKKSTMQAPETLCPRPPSVVSPSSRSSSDSSDFTDASDSSGGYGGFWIQGAPSTRGGAHDTTTASSAPKRNPFNRRRDAIKTAAPVTSLRDLNQIPTRLSKLGEDGRFQESLTAFTSSDQSAKRPSRSVSPHPSLPSTSTLAGSKVSWAPNVKDPSKTRRSPGKPHLPRLLPSDYIPSDKDVVIELQDEETFSESITSLRFEVMIHASLLKYIRASRQERFVMVDRIVSAVSAEQGRFVRYCNGKWIKVDRDTARDFTANEMKFAARDVLRRIQAKRKAMTALLHSVRGDRNRVSTKHKLQAKFKVPRRMLMVIPPDAEVCEPRELKDSRSPNGQVCQPENPLELLSKVAMSLRGIDASSPL